MSHCSAISKRDDLAADLSQYIDIDVYGSCGNKQLIYYFTFFSLIAFLIVFFISFIKDVQEIQTVAMINWIRNINFIYHLKIHCVEIM